MTKAVAAWLVILILTPFTAPFSTCDLASALGQSTHRSRNTSPSELTAATEMPVAPVVTPIARSLRLKLVRLSIDRQPLLSLTPDLAVRRCSPLLHGAGSQTTAPSVLRL